jgi:uncharacterized iron-regulated protein
MHWEKLFALVFLLVLAAGCAVGPKPAPGPDMGRDLIVDLKTARETSFEGMMDQLGRARVVFLGEMHTHPAQHRRQLRIVKALKQRGHDLVIGLELFEREQQQLLDDWLAGETPVGRFHQLVGRVLSPDAARVYLPLLHWAKKAGVPLIALNAPRPIVAKTAREGLESLTPDERSRIAREIVVGPAPYQARVAEAMTHHEGMMDLDRFFTAQVVWDETMSETLAEALACRGPNVTAVVIAGNEHVRCGYGIPNRLARRVDVSQASVLMPISGESDPLSAQTADFAWPAAPLPEKERPRFGLQLDPADDGGLTVASVAPDSPAEESGFRAGDRVTGLNGREVASLMDLHRAAMSGRRAHVFTVRRQGREIQLTVRLFEADKG